MNNLFDIISDVQELEIINNETQSSFPIIIKFYSPEVRMYCFANKPLKINEVYLINDTQFMTKSIKTNGGKYFITLELWKNCGKMNQYQFDLFISYMNGHKKLSDIAKEEQIKKDKEFKRQVELLNKYENALSYIEL